VASRLSAGLPLSSILVLEAGVDAPDDPKINIPGNKGSTFGTSYDWNFTTTPQPNAGNRRWAQTRGKVLGGSSALNLMTWDRASQYEYDEWETLGNPGWNWNTLFRAMLKVETFFGSSEGGTAGPIQTLINRFIPKQQDFFIPTLNTLDVPTNLESLDGNPLGVMFQPSNLRETDYKRSYAAHNPGYPSVAGDNLEIWTATRVEKINIVPVNGSLVATSVTLDDGSIVSAKNEVILSAGSLQSPGLLELSGIGDSEILTSMGIQVLNDLPGVGENLQDHLRIQSSYQLRPNFTSFDILKFNTTFAAEQMALYNASQKSIYDYTGSGYAFVNWTTILGDDSAMQALAVEASQNQLTTSPFEKNRASILREYLANSTKNVPQVEVIFSDGYTGVKGYPPVSSPLFGIELFSLIAAIQHPFSLGSVHITSSNISIAPAINPNYLAQEYDVQAAIEAAKYLRKIANTHPLSQAWLVEYEPGLDVVSEVGTDEEWRNYVTNNTLTIYHPAGTCAMLPQSENGVVGPDLVVYGTSNLRVVDASIIPIIVSAHIQNLVYGIAEMASDMIIGKYN
jgi:choline dehydrogenase-like flavoprotein